MTTTTKTPTIRVNDRVRSFDFPSRPNGRALSGLDACYVEGVVIGIADPEEGPFELPGEGRAVRFGDCPRYVIRVTRKVWTGKTDDEIDPAHRYACPPVNGTKQLFDEGPTDFVEPLDAPETILRELALVTADTPRTRILDLATRAASVVVRGEG